MAVRLMLGVVAIAALIPNTSEARTGVLSLSAGIMGLTNSSTVSGQGPSGTTFLSQTDFMVSHKFYAGGLFFGYDKQGKNQTDTMFGPKVELFWRVFFAEFGYGFIMNRAFTDRSVATQKGNGFYYGIGVNIPLKGGGKDRAKGMFLQFTYKMRTQNVKEQDGTEVPYEIQQQDGFPLMGVGYAF